MKLLKFYTDWCQPCKMMSPVVKIACERTGIECEDVDADADQRASDFDVKAVPTLILVRDGKEVDRKIGPTPLKTLVDWISGHGV